MNISSLKCLNNLLNILGWDRDLAHLTQRSIGRWSEMVSSSTAENLIGVFGETRNKSRTEAEVGDTWVGEVIGCCRLWLLMKSSNNLLSE